MTTQVPTNFTLTDDWNNAVFLRYDFDKIFPIDNITFALSDDVLKCQNYFDICFDNHSLDQFEYLLKSNYQLKFSYINDGENYNNLKKWAEQKKYNFEIIDEWEAPLLKNKTNISDYLCDSKHSQIKKNYYKYKKNIHNYTILNSDDNDILKLWKYVLYIDFNSWKYREKSDMKSLSREDLQYYPYMQKNKENINLVVLLKNNIPYSYSLMFKTYDMWYQVKWGSSDLGRNEYTGFYCLFNHLEYLYKKDPNYILDFWGRRNETYDKLKNDFIIRRHILIRR